MARRKVVDKDASRRLAIASARIARDDNYEDILVLDLRGISTVTDYLVIATGSSGRQMKTVAVDVVDHGKSVGQRPWHVEGMNAADWILVDFVDVVVHLFDRPLRSYYDLELIWGEAPRVDWADGP